MTPTPGPGNTEFSPSDTRSSERRTATLRRTGRPRGHTQSLCSLQGPYDRSATFFGDMTGAGRRLARKRWPWPNSLRRLSPDYDYPPFRGLMWTTSRPSGSPARYSASQPPRTDCPNLVPTSQPRTRAEAYHGLGLQHPTAYLYSVIQCTAFQGFTAPQILSPPKTGGGPLEAHHQQRPPDRARTVA